MNAQSKVEAATLPQAMALAFAEIEAALKDATNPHFKSKYADLTSVIGAIKPALINHGLYFTQHCHPSEDGVMVETFLGHASGEEKSLGKLYLPANKRDAQGFGSALTYARRYALQTAFGVPTEDDDGNAAVKSGNGDALIDDAQFAHLVATIAAVGADTQRFCQYMRVPSLKAIKSRDFQKAKDALEARKPAPKKEVEPV